MSYTIPTYMTTIEELHRIFIEGMEKLQGKVNLNTEILKRTESRVKKMNGSIERLNEWKIYHEAELNLLKRQVKFIVIPVCVSVAVALIVNYLHL